MFSAATKTGSQPSAAFNYVEDVFSTYLYTGNGSTQTITNGIDLSGKGGLVWVKSRNNSIAGTIDVDTVRGASKFLITSETQQEGNAGTNSINGFTSTGFSVKDDSAGDYGVNGNAYTYASWTFRKQPKFFDVVTYTGTGSNTTISHNLGSAPGMIIVKRTDASGAWQVYHRSLANTEYLVLNTTAAKATGATRWNSTTPTSSVFSLGTDATVNASGGTYVAYLFAHNAGGFGTTGTDNVISCSSYTTDGSGNASVSLGYEPQYVLVKKTDGTSGWYQQDIMRSMSQTGALYFTYNTSNAEADPASPLIVPTATGFDIVGGGYGTGTFIYMAIRRPMKVPTDATTVFAPYTRAGNSTNTDLTNLNFAPDLALQARLEGGYGATFFDRLRGPSDLLYSLGTSAELTAYQDQVTAYNNTGISLGTDSTVGSCNLSGFNFANYNFARRPGFCDEVCYTGTGSATTQTHNLGVVPELMIVKKRSASANWQIYLAALANTEYLVLNTTAAKATGTTRWNSTTPTTSAFTIGTDTTVNASGATYVAYLFATCPGVSKVGSYTGNGSTQAIACGFTGGARFVLIKRTDSTGDWYCFDSANGFTSSSSPYVTWNTGSAQITGNNGVYGSSGGFTLGATALLTANIVAASYIFLAIA
jgi:hypothetical protein